MNNHLPPIQPSQQQPLDHHQQLSLSYNYYSPYPPPPPQPGQSPGTQTITPTTIGARLPFPSPGMPSPAESASDGLSNTSSPHVGGVRRRPSSSLTGGAGGAAGSSSKRARREEEDDGDSQSQSPAADGVTSEVVKPKTTRGSRYACLCIMITWCNKVHLCLFFLILMIMKCNKKQSLHRLSPSQDEMCRCGTGPAMQTVHRGQS
jgi:hypothetical protein